MPVIILLPLPSGNPLVLLLGLGFLLLMLWVGGNRWFLGVLIGAVLGLIYFLVCAVLYPLVPLEKLTRRFRKDSS